MHPHREFSREEARAALIGSGGGVVYGQWPIGKWWSRYVSHVKMPGYTIRVTYDCIHAYGAQPDMARARLVDWEVIV